MSHMNESELYKYALEQCRKACSKGYMAKTDLKKLIAELKWTEREISAKAAKR